jgi:hypothetical protein
LLALLDPFAGELEVDSLFKLGFKPTRCTRAFASQIVKLAGNCPIPFSRDFALFIGSVFRSEPAVSEVLLPLINGWPPEDLAQLEQILDDAVDELCILRKVDAIGQLIAFAGKVFPARADKWESHIFDVFDAHNCFTDAISLIVAIGPAHENDCIDSGCFTDSRVNSLSAFWSCVYHHRDRIAKVVENDRNAIQAYFKFLWRTPSLFPFKRRLADFRHRMRGKLTNNVRTVSVRRDHMLEDSFDFFKNSGAREACGQIRIQFVREHIGDQRHAFDEWCRKVSDELFSPAKGLFRTAGEYLVPNPQRPSANGNIDYFWFAGVFLAFVLIHGTPVSVHIAPCLLKRLIDLPTSVDDLQGEDDDLGESLRWILSHPAADCWPRRTFTERGLSPSDLTNAGGQKTYAELIPGGAEKRVTDENKGEYVRLMVKLRLDRGMDEQSKKFVKGFLNLVPREEVRMFSALELDGAISGRG